MVKGDIDLSVHQKFIIPNMRHIAFGPGGCVARSLISEYGRPRLASADRHLFTSRLQLDTKMNRLCYTIEKQSMHSLFIPRLKRSDRGVAWVQNKQSHMHWALRPLLLTLPRSLFIIFYKTNNPIKMFWHEPVFIAHTKMRPLNEYNKIFIQNFVLSIRKRIKTLI